MGWNYLKMHRRHELLRCPEETQRFYFLHSFHVAVENDRDVVATTEYGYRFPSVIGRDNILGVQFHPEKSHRYGLALFRRFQEWTPC